MKYSNVATLLLSIAVAGFAVVADVSYLQTKVVVTGRNGRGTENLHNL